MTSSKKNSFSSNYHYFFLFLLFSLVTAVVTIFFYFTLTPVYTLTYTSSYTIDDYVGFNLTNDNTLNFGTIPQNMKSERTLQFTPYDDFFVTVSLDDLPHIIPKTNHFLVTQGEQHNLVFALIVPPDAVPRSYQGTITIQFRKPSLMSIQFSKLFNTVQTKK